VVLVDTSVWIDLFRDTTGGRRTTLLAAVAGDEIVLTCFHQLELLQGAADEPEWTQLSTYLDEQTYLELGASSWAAAARTYFDLRRLGKTVRSPVDCCIAQVALDHDVLLLHRDRDFETIAAIRPLRQLRLRW
jgi:predicted nucleic acid-binding protein